MNVADPFDWLNGLLDGSLPADGTQGRLSGQLFHRDGSMLRSQSSIDDAGQLQTKETFAFKWQKTDTYTSPAMSFAIRDWLHARYSRLIDEIDASESKLSFIDLGCGGGNAAALLLQDRWQKVDYVGCDISDAVSIARERLEKEPGKKAFVQADLMALPFLEQSFDIVFSEGVLHHTPSTKAAVQKTLRLVKPGGRYAIYVYSKKAPIREFTDDLIRDQLSTMSPQEAWDALMPLTKLGATLGELEIEIDVNESVDLLGIPAGKINLQRLFYWYVFKAFYREDFTLKEMNHINFDWFTPIYAFRQTPDETKSWIEDSGLVVEELKTELAGHTILARRPG